MRFRWIAVALSLVTAIAGLAAAAQRYPVRPVRIIVPFGAGGSLSVLSLAMGRQLGEKWGQQPVVDPRPGAGGNIGAEAVARSPADGYTLMFTTQSLAANATLAPTTSFDPIRSFDPVAIVGSGQNIVIVPSSSPFKSLKDLIDYAKAHPGELSAASVGIGSTSYLATELFKSVTGVDAVLVPYNGAAPASTDVIAGRIGFWVTTLGSVLPNITNGQMRGLAISGNRRADALPDVPTFAELGYDKFKANAWFALFAPAGTPKEIVVQLNVDVNQALAVAGVQERFRALSIDPAGGTPEDLRALLSEEIETWARLFKKPENAQK
ncbi:MAG: tripartite tricarboxylate transporter substrate binding protein [Alphaproteobacteria bacterium]|nr:tripartite tricarboxylate transporter substrate binding protein [Alphaproteobacteria bacterium]